MRETQRNIRNYQKRLVGVKEKLATAGLLFLMSAVMLTTASFAWITLSVAPEVANISTTIVGNGNLEIALASSDENGLAKLPEASQVGDSNKDLVEKNITWGNLVNLNDNNYGLNQIVLRPATLNTSSTLDSPLRAVEYSKDGRIEMMNYDFSYSNYDVEEDKFVIDSITDYGVRAISSVLITASGEDAERNVELRNNLISSLETSKQTYTGLVTNKEYLNSIAGLMGVFLTDQLNNSDSNVKSYMPTFYKMVQEFDKAMTELGETYVKIANVQITKLNLTMNSYTSLNELLNESQSTLSSKNIKLMTGFDTFKRDYNNLKTHMANIEATLSKDSVLLDSIFNDINFMVEIDTCKIDDTFTVAQMGNMGMGDLLGMLSGTHKGVIQGGVLQRYEQLTGAKMDAKNITISAKYSGIPASVKANISTSAAEPFTVPQLIEGNGRSARAGEYSCILDIIFGNSQMIETAADVYGMSIDLWLRTNASNSYLVLEGKPELVYEVQTTSSNYIIYENEDGRQFYHIPDKDHPAPAPNTVDPMKSVGYLVNEKVIVEHYLNYGTFYGVATNQPVTFLEPDEEDDNGISNEREAFVSALKYSPKTVVIGYDGVNRIWEESADLVDGTSTTQGKGSCFIFYPEDPLEQERMLNVLSALSVAFIDDNGDILAKATLNPKHAYEEIGKVTIPLELTEDSSFYINDSNEEIHYITSLVSNEAKMISAIVYIDGEYVSNEDVNATSGVNGFLNLQFGSTETLNSIVDESLQAQYVKATATVDRNFFEVTEIPATTTVNLEIKGISALNKNVQMNFVRKINDYQGVQLEPMTMSIVSSSEDSSTLIGTQIFNNPGVYVLNSVWVDGIEYELVQQLSVEVEGFKINSISWDSAGEDVLSGNDVYKMTSNNSYGVELTVDVAASEQFRPSKMSAMFRNEYNEYVTINLSENSDVWTGVGTFITSGKYELQYLYINDDIYYVDSEFKKTITLVLGINASVDLEYVDVDTETEETIIQSGANIQFEWDATNTSSNVVNIKSVKICDNKGNIIEGLDGVKLYYGLTGSTNTNIYAELVWNPSQGSYTGKITSNTPQQFLISTPGVYRFDRVFISDTSTEDANDGSEIRNATASTVITATSPYPVEFHDEMLTADSYQFAPGQNASFTVGMKYSSAASVYAKMTYYGDSLENDGVTYFVPGIVANNDIENMITTWSFTPFIGAVNEADYPITNGVIDRTLKNSNFYNQDGIWVIEDIRLVNVYSIDEVKTEETGQTKYKWYSAPGDNWWTSTAEGDYVTWDVEDKSSDILGKIYATVSYDSGNRSQENFQGDFTDSLSGKYTISGYSISYSDSIGRTTKADNNPLALENWNLAVSAQLGYTYSASSDAALKSDGWLLTVDGSAPNTGAYQTEMEKQIINFNNNDQPVIFKYPGSYTAMLTVKLTDLSGNTLESRATGMGTITGANLVVVNSVNNETVSWVQPSVEWNSISPDSSRDLYTGLNVSWAGISKYQITSTMTVRNNLSKADNNIDVYIRMMKNSSEEWTSGYKMDVRGILGGLASYADLVPTNATAELKNAGAIKSAKTVIEDDKYPVTFSFSSSSLTNTQAIGKGSTSGHSKTKVASGSHASTISIVIVDTSNNEHTYVFRLPKPLTVNKNNSTEW